MDVAPEPIITLLTNAGVSIGVIAYFMYRDFRFMDTLTKTLTTLVDTVDTLKDIVKDKKDDD